MQVQGIIEPEEPGTPTEPPVYEGTGIVPEEISIVEIPDDNPLNRGRRPPVPGSYSTGKVGDIIPILPAREVPRRPIEPPKGKHQPPPRPERRSPEEEMGRPEPRSRQIPPIRREPPPRREPTSRRDRPRKRLSDTEEMSASQPVENAPASPTDFSADPSTEGLSPTESDPGLNWMEAPPPIREQRDQLGS